LHKYFLGDDNFVQEAPIERKDENEEILEEILDVS
jgi:hypothetical protein